VIVVFSQGMIVAKINSREPWRG